MAEYPDNLPVCWWTPSGYETGPLPRPFAQACKDDKIDEWKASLAAQGYQFADCTRDADCSDFGVTCWRHYGAGETKPHLAVELWNTSHQLAILCVPSQHMAAFWLDKWPELCRSQRCVDEPSLTKAIIAFIRHGHGETTINESGTENFDERRDRIDRGRRQAAQREALAKADKS